MTTNRARVASLAALSAVTLAMALTLTCCGSSSGANVRYTGKAKVVILNEQKTKACVLPPGQDQICGTTLASDIIPEQGSTVEVDIVDVEWPEANARLIHFR